MRHNLYSFFFRLFSVWCVSKAILNFDLEKLIPMWIEKRPGRHRHHCRARTRIELFVDNESMCPLHLNWFLSFLLNGNRNWFVAMKMNSPPLPCQYNKTYDYQSIHMSVLDQTASLYSMFFVVLAFINWNKH